MKIKDIKENRIMPFEIDDEKIKSLFSFYLHKAPTIESKSSIDFNSSMLDERWTNFKNSISNIKTKFVSYSYTLDDLLKRMVDYGLDEESPVNRKTNAFVCKKKNIKKVRRQRQSVNAYYVICEIQLLIATYIYQIKVIENTYYLKTTILMVS